MIHPYPFIEIDGKIYNVSIWTEIELKRISIPNLPEQYKVMVRLGEREWLTLKDFSQRERAVMFYNKLKDFLGAKPL